ncbi:MAG: class I SAM-dependent methyltransferase [Saprospiraceae bacterium]|nr:class I SAM-dependent methyltransferase [Saprospiraceae bacterium]MCB9324391.1 class I SAM-dependent methyltransferase [Lewinellaceae bacterium]
MALNYLKKNKDSWNKRTEVHLESEFYNNKAFLEGANPLDDIVLNILGDIKGKTVLHLQCHFGQDTLQMARMGAKTTGVDLSDKAIEAARKFNEQLGLDSRFICCDVYDLPNHLEEKFDIVFTSYGTIGWLPDIDRWAAVVSRFLKPGGQFIFAEFHPVVWMFDDAFSKVEYRYFQDEPIVEFDQGTYTDGGEHLKTESVSWNHGLAEVMSSLIRQGIELLQFEEYDYSPYACFSPIEQIGERKFRIKHLGDKIPMVYSLVGRKK